MTDLGNRFSDDEGERRGGKLLDPLARLRVPADQDAQADSRPSPVSRLRGRADLVAGICATLAVFLLAWPLLDRPTLNLPEVTDTGDEVATLTVRPLMENGAASVPDWAGLFDAYHIETTLRDASIRCNFGLPVDARVDRYLHAPLGDGTTIRVFLINPGKCPRF